MSLSCPEHSGCRLIYQQIDQLLFTFTLNTEFIVPASINPAVILVGFIITECKELVGWNGSINLDIKPIGSIFSCGVLLALANQHSQLSLAQTIYNVYRAKRSAEVAPGVGPATDMA